MTLPARVRGAFCVHLNLDTQSETPYAPPSKKRVLVISTSPIMPPKSFAQHIDLLAKPRGSLCYPNCAYRFYLNYEQLCLDSRFRMSDAMPEMEK